MQLEIRTNNYLDSLQDQFVDFPIVRKEIKEILIHPDVVDIGHRDNCHCNECYKYGVGSYWGRKE